MNYNAMGSVMGGGGFSGGTVPDATTFSGNVIIQGTLDVTGVATFTTTVTGSGDIYAGAAFDIGFTGRGKFKSSADGIISLLNAAEDGFTRLNFGGTTSSFPAWARSTTTLKARLADDSADAGITALTGVFTGSVTATALIPTASTVPANGLYLPGANIPGLSANSTIVVAWNSTVNWNFISGMAVGWMASGTPVGTPDTTIGRSAPAVAQIGSSGVSASLIGALKCATLVEANVAGSGAPNILTVGESRTLLTNEGTTAENYHTLPLAAAGLTFTFYVQDTDGIRITANTADTIRVAAGVSAGAGFVRCATAGAIVRLTAINATEWVAEYQTGVWTVDV